MRGFQGGGRTWVDIVTAALSKCAARRAWVRSLHGRTSHREPVRFLEGALRCWRALERSS